MATWQSSESPLATMEIGSTTHNPSYQCEPDRSVEGLGSSKSGKLPRHGRDWSPCSSESTCREGSRLEDYKEGNGTRRISNRVSSRSRPVSCSSPAPSAFEDREWSPRVSRPPVTTREVQYRIVYARSLVEVRRNGEHSVVGCCRCKSRHHVGNMPKTCQKRSNLHIKCVFHTLIAACRDRAISLSCSSLGLLPRISGSQN